MFFNRTEFTKNVKDEEHAAYLMKNGVKFDYGSLVDERDGEIYSTVKIGNQIWMAENLRYVSKGGAADDDVGSYAYGEVEKNVGKFGRLYTWAAAMNLSPRYNEDELGAEGESLITSGRFRGIAPEGWHIPSEEEWHELCEFCRSLQDGLPGTMLKSSEYWEECYGSVVGKDSVGFASIPSGGRYSMGYFYDLNKSAYYWTSTSMGNEYARYRSISFRGGKIGADYTYKTDAFAIRCVKDC